MVLPEDYCKRLIPGLQKKLRKIRSFSIEDIFFQHLWPISLCSDIENEIESYKDIFLWDCSDIEPGLTFEKLNEEAIESMVQVAALLGRKLSWDVHFFEGKDITNIELFIEKLVCSSMYEYKDFGFGSLEILKNKIKELKEHLRSRLISHMQNQLGEYSRNPNDSALLSELEKGVSLLKMYNI